jgi:hypothetical protein
MHGTAARRHHQATAVACQPARADPNRPWTCRTSCSRSPRASPGFVPAPMNHFPGTARPGTHHHPTRLRLPREACTGRDNKERRTLRANLSSSSLPRPIRPEIARTYGRMGAGQSAATWRARRWQRCCNRQRPDHVTAVAAADGRATRMTLREPFLDLSSSPPSWSLKDPHTVVRGEY